MRTPDAGPDLDRMATHAVEMLGRDLFTYALRRVPSPQDADDVTAAVFLVIWEHRARLPHTDQDLRRWCFGIARNKVREHLRSIGRHADRETSSQAELPSTNVMDPAVAATRSEETALVHTALRMLDAKSRELVMLINWDGLTIAEAASLLRINESSARTRYARARTRLRNLVSSPAVTRTPGTFLISEAIDKSDDRRVDPTNHDPTLTHP